MPATLAKIADSIDNDSLEDAAKLLDETPQTPENRAELAFLAGYLKERARDIHGAMETYESVLEMDQDHTEALFRLAFLCDLRGDDEKAIEYYERCIAEPPAHVNALINLSLLYEENKRLREAQDCLTRVLDENANHTRARLFDKHLESTINMVYDDEASMRSRERDVLFDTPVTEFELSVRSRNCLKQMGLHTVGDLLRVTESELLNYKNFGETSLNEIKALLTQKGLRLGQAMEESLTTDAEGTDTLPSVVGDPAVLGRPVSELELSVRSRRCLQRLGITTLEELVSRSEAELLAIKNFGLTSLNEIRRQLKERGLSLRGSHH